MTDTDRDRSVRAVHDRVRRAVEGEDPGALFGQEADAELRALMTAADLRTDMEARWCAGWFFWCRCAALGEGRGAVEGGCAGTLLLPVWAADPEAVPEELAAGYARAPRDRIPDPRDADGPGEWHGLCVVCTSAVEGRLAELPSEAHGLLAELRAEAEAISPPGQVPEQPEEVTVAIACGTLAALATPVADPAYPVRVAALASALSAAGRLLREPASLDQAVQFTHHALKHTPATDPERLDLLSNLGLVLRERYELAHDPGDLDEAIGIARDVVAQAEDHRAETHRAGDRRTGPGHPGLARYLSSLAYVLQLRLRHEGDTPDRYDEVVGLFRRAAPGDPNGREAGLLNLAGALVQRSTRTGSVRDLDEAVSLLTEALRLPCRDPRLRAGLTGTLAIALRTRHARTGRAEDLERAAALVGPDARNGHARKGHAQAGPDVVARTPAQLANAALVLRARYDHDGDVAALREALALLREAVGALPAGHPDRPSALSNLGSVLFSSHQHSGAEEELAEAVDVLREAVARTPRGHQLLAVRLLNLGGVLRLRHDLTGDSADLRESLRCRRDAAGLPDLPPTERAAILSATGIATLRSAGRTQDPADVEEAIDRMRAAVELTPEGDRRLPARRLNLAGCLLARFGRTGRRRDLREARALADAALAALPAGSEERKAALVVAAEVRAAGLRVLWSPGAQQEVTGLLREAVDGTPEGHPARARRLYAAGRVLRARHDRTRRPADLEEAAGLFRDAARAAQCPPSERLEAAREWAVACGELGRMEAALEGWVLAVDLLPSLAPRHLVRHDQEFWLGRAVGLGAEAAACAVRCGDPALAVTLLERARGILLAQAFDADVDLAELRAAAPELAGRFVRLRESLDATTGAHDLLDEKAPGATAEGMPSAEPRRRLAAEWRELTARIRAEHPELGLFRPVGAEDAAGLRAAAAEGPVVLVNVSRLGSAALIVTERSIDAEPLPDLTPQEVAARTRRFQDALARLESPECTGDEALRAQREVRGTLAWLWSAVTGPVLARLGLTAPPAPGRPWPRLWWSPGGALGTLPLHAAAPPNASPGALDLVVSSYTPTVRALRHARTRERRAGREPARLLAVAVPEAEGLPPLHEARGEAAWLGGLFPGTTVLEGAAAGRAAVEARLRDHSYAHFACHTVGDPHGPSAGRLVLHGPAGQWPTVRDLSRLRLPAARLAYLSACDTLRTSPGLADEAVHVVSALQMAGFAHVVGSLWHVDDTVGARIARTVYETLGTGGGGLDAGRTAWALHRAVRQVREEYPATPSLWACHVHAGP
ncbi:CHAT domain-containing protein [Streptomyces sp. NPDC053048]|uniref:CHAT domain-containing tetratricopeptide repeat protein n=1 Tax=Streptomyces sp. NPDC053048 TaxID=3365694 RepID=UPI0037CDFF65